MSLYKLSIEAGLCQVFSSYSVRAYQVQWKINEDIMTFWGQDGRPLHHLFSVPGQRFFSTAARYSTKQPHIRHIPFIRLSHSLQKARRLWYSWLSVFISSSNPWIYCLMFLRKSSSAISSRRHFLQNLLGWSMVYFTPEALSESAPFPDILFWKIKFLKSANPPVLFP